MPRQTSPGAPKAGAGFAAAVQEIAKTIQAEGNVRAVFGDPIKIGKHTIVPVASIGVGLGGGGGGVAGLPLPSKAQKGPLGRMLPSFTPTGGGGGMSIEVKPLGYLAERGGEIVFVPISQ